ncbi:hypothetical protein [Anaerolentibacter hominis]|uniref:hypothetical protein n=1 Tax=Anaerolentibacter hominis TaxID=3079009 RepID=UPI0031B85F22
MNKEMFRLPLGCLAAGILLDIASKIYISVRLDKTAGTEITAPDTFFFMLLLSLVIFIVIGFLLHRTQTRDSLIRSATLIVAYGMIVLFLERVVQHFGLYPAFMTWLFLPLKLFDVITDLLLKVTGAGQISMLLVLPSLFAPYLFVLFGKKEAGEQQEVN